MDDKKHTFCDYALQGLINLSSVYIRECMHVCATQTTYVFVNKLEPDFHCLAYEIAEPRPDMNIKVAALTVSKKSINMHSYLEDRYEKSFDYQILQLYSIKCI